MVFTYVKRDRREAPPETSGSAAAGKLTADLGCARSPTHTHACAQLTGSAADQLICQLVKQSAVKPPIRQPPVVVPLYVSLHLARAALLGCLILITKIICVATAMQIDNSAASLLATYLMKTYLFGHFN